MKDIALGVALASLLVATPNRASDLTETLAVNGIFAGAYQCQAVSKATPAEDACRGAMVVQPEIGIRPSDADEFFFKFGFAAGNGLNEVSPFIQTPWAAAVEADLVDINGRQRDYLLTAWYQRRFKSSSAGTFSATLGIIDGADYLDGNAYASDEYTQFMNSALTNAPNVFLPSFDLGGALTWERGRWLVSAVAMNVGANDDGNSFVFYGAQAGVAVETPLGEGHYRVMIDGANEAFLDPAGTALHARRALMLNFDQQLGDVLGAFLRFGWQDEKAAVDYKAIYSGGIDISGRAWKRANDNIGIAYAYIAGGNLDVAHSHIAEVYYRLAADDDLALTADLQYLRDDLHQSVDADGFVVGLRATAEF